MAFRKTLIPVALALTTALIHSTAGVTATTYSIVKDYSGSSFFNEWDFYGQCGYLSAQDSFSSKLAYVDSQINHAIIKVDNTSTVPYDQKRSSVKITTKATYAIGSIWLADIYHAPYGCSVWPSWWSFAPAATWPDGGEIDTFEAINQMTSSQMGLHTNAGCSQTSPKQSSSIVNSTDCSGPEDQGCIVTDSRPGVYGQQFATSGGGVYITEFAASGISVWFIPRANVPISISSNSSTIDTSQLGTPVGNWPNTGCDINKFFQPQSLVFSIPLCGKFAGNSAIFNQTCQGVCYNDFVLGNGSNYATAYFEIASVRVFSQNATGTSNTTTGNQTTGGNTKGSSSLGFVDLKMIETSILLVFLTMLGLLTV